MALGMLSLPWVVWGSIRFAGRQASLPQGMGPAYNLSLSLVGTTHISRSDLSPREQLERQAEFHSSTQDEA